MGKGDGKGGAKIEWKEKRR